MIKHLYLIAFIAITLIFNGSVPDYKAFNCGEGKTCRKPCSPKIPPSELYYHIMVGELFQAEREWIVPRNNINLLHMM
jgi:hypothetical protein